MPEGPGEPAVDVHGAGPSPIARSKGTPSPKGKAAVRKADMGDIQAVEKELYSALLPTNPKVGVGIMARASWKSVSLNSEPARKENNDNGMSVELRDRAPPPFNTPSADESI